MTFSVWAKIQAFSISNCQNIKIKMNLANLLQTFFSELKIIVAGPGCKYRISRKQLYSKQIRCRDKVLVAIVYGVLKISPSKNVPLI